jgi:hypothetical protein
MMTSSGLSDPVEIAEVDRFRSDLECPQHDGRVFRAPTQPFGKPHEREIRGRGRWRMRRRGEESSSKGTPSIQLCALLLPRGPPYIGG